MLGGLVPFPQTPFFEKIGSLFDYYADEPVKVEKVREKTERPPKEIFYIPALIILALVFWMQRRRVPNSEALGRAA